MAVKTAVEIEMEVEMKVRAGTGRVQKVVVREGLFACGSRW